MAQQTSLGSFLRISNMASTPSWDEVAYVESWSQDDPGKPKIPATHLRSTRREELSGLPDPGTLTLVVFHDTDESSHATLETLHESGDLNDFELNLESGAVYLFSASVDQFSRNAAGPDQAYRATIVLDLDDILELQ